MDDEELYGPEFHRLGFGEAVERDLLTDYKVLVLAVDETSVAAHLPGAALRRQQRAPARRRRQDRRLLERAGQARQGRALLRARHRADAPRRRLRRQHQGLQADRGALHRRHRPLRRSAGLEDETARSPLSCEVRARRRHLQRPRAQHAASTGSRRRPSRQHLPHPDQRPLPLRGRRRPGARRGDVPVAAQVRRRHRPVGRPGDAQGARARSSATSSCRSASRPG